MELFDYLIEKRKNSGKRQHPFARTEEYFRRIYAFGIGVLAMGHMSAIEELKDQFNDFLSCVNLPGSFCDDVIIELNNNFDFRINEVFKKIDTKQKQYCFFLDLYLVSQHSKWSREYAEAIIHYYAQAFRFSGKEESFFKSFMSCAEKKDTETSIGIYENFLSQGHIISYAFLTYAFPSFHASKEYSALRLGEGQQMIIDRPTHVHGSIEVNSSSFLSIESTELTVDGGILVDGGKLQIKNCSIQIRDCREPFAVSIKNTAGVIAENLKMDAGGQCGFWHQLQGTLILENCSFTNAGINPGIYFNGRNLSIDSCSFSNCTEGGIYCTGSSSMNTVNSRFISCYAENGGGIYCDSMKDITVKSCKFEKCRAKYNGSAVYFKNQKFGQMVKNCEIINCTPETNAIFNAFSKGVFK